MCLTMAGYYCLSISKCFMTVTEMDDDKFLDKIHKSRCTVEAKLSFLLVKLKQELNSMQERALQRV